MELIRLLNDPPREFTPIPFWFLNGDLEPEEMRRQLRDFRDHGVFGVVLHPRMGMDPAVEYLSEHYFELLRSAVESAAEQDMRVVLYDEGMYPSGSACGLVVQGHLELASRGLGLTEKPRPGDTVLCETPQGFLVERFSGGTIRGIHFGEDDGEPNAPASADILNPAAVERFIELTHEACWRHLAAHFGKTVIGFFTDEPSILGRNAEPGLQPWTRGFSEIYTAAGGDLRDLAALFSGQENEGTRLYRALILRRESEVYYGRLSRWCAAHGIALMGHPHQSDDLEVEKYFQIPGQDLVYRWVSPERGGTAGMDSTMAKCSADAARLMGRRRNSNECFGACNRDDNPWYFTGEDMKWMIDWLAVRGVNLFIPHAFYYSLEGPRSAERPPDVGPGSIWWPHYRKWSAYMARLSCLMTDARLRAEVAVLCRNRDLRPEAAAPLFETQRGFQYLPESAWPMCREEEGRLIFETQRYRAAIGETEDRPDVPDQPYRAVIGEAERFPSVPHHFDGAAPDVLCDPPQPLLRAARFERAGTECWLLVNEGEQPLETMLTLPTEQPVGRYDLWTGKAARVLSEPDSNGKRLRLSLPRRGSLLLFACPADRDWRMLEESRPAAELACPRFETYTAILAMDKRDLPAEQAVLTVGAEEMAELYVNDVFCDVSFWSPHRLFIPADVLREGENTLRLVVTGSLANRYGRAPVWYGILGEKGS